MPKPPLPRRSERNGDSSGGRPSGKGAKNGKFRGRVESHSGKKGTTTAVAEKFILYVEGPRDREVLSTWARRVDPEINRLIDRCSTILGGRQPARALADFRKRGGAAEGWKGLIVLDRDDRDLTEAALEAEDLLAEGLELFVWGLRHIESYLLVPSVLRRLQGIDPDDRRIEEIVEAATALDEGAAVHAKRILGTGGALSRALGVPFRAGEIARAMRREDLHDDVLDLFYRIGKKSGIGHVGPEVVLKPRRSPQPEEAASIDPE